MMTVRQILEEAKRLEPIERAELLEQLYATFEPADPSVDAAWSVEVEERLSAYRAGEIEAAPFEDVLDRINRFPYALVYADDGNQLLILAVMRRSRHRDSWKDRASVFS
jgi:putative addiction module component (TIGR02574 family)